jgi:hypothetical protein
VTTRTNRLRLGALGALIAAVALAVALSSGSALAASGGGKASGWHIGYYNPGGNALSFAQAAQPASGLAMLNFTNQANTALLVTDQKAQFPNLLGDMTNKTLSATATISGLTGAFFYYGQPDACGGTTSYVRYYFATSNAGGFDETHYWWSNPVAAPLATNGPVVLTPVSTNGANWSDFYGHFGSDPSYSAGFNAAISNVTEIGLSYGGGCFFENGVGTTDGSGTFTLNGYNAS